MSDHALLMVIAGAATFAALGAVFAAHQVERIRELIEEWQIEQSRARRGISDDPIAELLADPELDEDTKELFRGDDAGLPRPPL